MKRNKRSWGLWLVILAFALLSLSGWQRLFTSQASWYWLAQAGAFPGPLYLAVSGALWGVVGLLTAGWLLAFGRAYRRVGVGAALFFLLTYWVDRLLISRADGLGANLGFAVLASLFGLAYITLVLRQTNRKIPAGVDGDAIHSDK